MDNKTTVYEQCKIEIYRIGWRVQYRAKVIKQRECPIYYKDPAGDCFSVSSENRIMVQQLLGTLPHRGRMILYKLYFQGQTESEVARQLNMSQQGVSKWKKKMIRQLSQIVNS